MSRALLSDGQGFGQAAVVSTVPVVNSGGGPARLLDLEVGDFIADGQSQALVLATGELPLVVVNPQAGTALPPAAVELQQGSVVSKLNMGTAIALGRIGSRQVAAIAGSGSIGGEGGPVLALVDVSTPAAPLTLNIVKLFGGNMPTDVALLGDLVIATDAYGAQAYSVVTPEAPRFAGFINGVAGRLAVDPIRGLLFSTVGGFQPAPLGGLRITTILSDPCEVPTPGSFPMSFPVAQLGWSMQAVITPSDGVRLSTVKLRDRVMATQISLPYLELETDHLASIRCELLPDGVSACPGTPTPVRSRLVALSQPASAQQGTKAFALTATYLLDKLHGDPENPETPDAPNSCVFVTQRYQFFAQNQPHVDPCEASGKAPCARFKPIVEYRYLSDGPALKALKAAQRLHFRIVEPPPSTPSTSNVATLFHDCDTTDSLGTCVVTWPPVSNPGAPLGLPFHVVGAFGNENPLAGEAVLRVVEQGSATEITDDKGTSRSVDNLHQSSLMAVDEPDLNPGCPECVHMHWRWSSVLEPPLFNVDPKFDNYDGKPIIPAGSNQDIDIGLVQFHPGEEDPERFEILKNDEALLPGTGLGPVFWYAATGHRSSDQFMTHGGFFLEEGALPKIANVVVEAVASPDITKRVSFDVENLTYDESGDFVGWTVVLRDVGGTVLGTLSGEAEAGDRINAVFKGPAIADARSASISVIDLRNGFADAREVSIEP